jgi:hypothetical protein
MRFVTPLQVPSFFSFAKSLADLRSAHWQGRAKAELGFNCP